MMNGKKYWPEQKQKSWYAVVVDVLCIGIAQEGKALERDRKRLRGLCGIIIRPANSSELMKFNAKTVLPSRILTLMSIHAERIKKVPFYGDKKWYI